MIRYFILDKKIIPAIKQSSIHFYHSILSVRLNTFKEHRLSVSIGACILFIFLMSLVFPPRGRIIPVGKEMQQAFTLLKSTEAGKKLVNKVQQKTKGTLIYMMLGTTNGNNLTDNYGNKVRGVTKAYFNELNCTYTPRGIIVYTNKDVTEKNPEKIVQSMAFELENVIYSMDCPGIEFGKDSPNAPVTQKLVCMELGL